MVQQRGELFILVPSCYFSHAIEPTLRTVSPALRPACVVLDLVPLGRAPLLHSLLHPFGGFVRLLRRYYEPVRLPALVHHRLVAFGLPDATRMVFSHGQGRDLPVLAQEGSVRAEGLRPRRDGLQLAITLPPMWPSASLNSVGSLGSKISRLDTSPARAPVNASPAASRPPVHDSGTPRIATPSVWGSCILSFLPVYPGALNDFETRQRII